MLTAIAPLLSEEERSEVLTQALDTALKVSFPSSQSQVLTRLIPLLSGELLTKALDEALKFAVQLGQEEALVASIPALNEIQLAQVFQETEEMQERLQARLLTALAPRLTSSQAEQALYVADSMKEQASRMVALAGLLPIFDSSSLLRTIRSLLIRELAQRSTNERSSVLWFLATDHVWALPVITPGIASTIVDHIIEICNEWHWL